MNRDIPLKDIVDIKRWQKIQDHFGQVIGIGVRTIDKEGNLLTKPSSPARFCEQVLSKCKKCLPSYFADLIVGEKWKDGYQCYAGLHVFSIPVIAPDQHTVAYLLVGPVFLGQRKEAHRYKEVAEELGIELDNLIDCIIEVKLLSFTGIQSVIELLNDIANYIVQLSYNKHKIEKILPIPKIGRMMHKFYIDKILHALLDVSFNTAGAQAGSIMLLDKNTGELYIKVARGIEKEIIKSARLKVGEGIAGLVVKEKRALLLDENFTDKKVIPRLKRPQIKSAFVAPFQVQNVPLGVISISTSRPSNRITPEKINTINRLIELTETTLSDLVM
ncbi:MAG: PocR ligand-binding domain-containing protein [Candidatus Omnitrophota bacterium]